MFWLSNERGGLDITLAKREGEEVSPWKVRIGRGAQGSL